MVQPILETKKLHLGCGRTILDGWVNLDLIPGPGVDVTQNLEECATKPLPFEDDTFSEFFASHLIEHVTNTLPMMQELHRVAKDGAIAVFRCPHGSNDDAFEDPTHVRQYFANSFVYFSQPAYWRADYGYRGDWQVVKTQLRLNAGQWKDKSPQDIIFAVQHMRNVVEELIVTLRAVKPIRASKQELLQVPAPEIIFA
jgi:SAM-dependent methyltransferase